MDIVLEKTLCRSLTCKNTAIIAFQGQDLCLDHFLGSCYDRLDELEKIILRRPLYTSAEMRKFREALEECSNRTLLVCLRHEPLTNLERSRLLGILLQCGDLRQILRKPLPTSPPCA